MPGWIHGCLDTVFTRIQIQLGVCFGLHFLCIQVLQTLTLLCKFLESSSREPIHARFPSAGDSSHSEVCRLCGKLADAFGFSQSVSHYVVEFTRATSQHPSLMLPHTHTDTHKCSFAEHNGRKDELNGSGKCQTPTIIACLRGKTLPGKI